MQHPFTDTFIQMAKAAEEIQAAWKPEAVNPAPDFYFCEHPIHGTSGVFYLHIRLPFPRLDKGKRAFWLPRLDQLLGMLGTPADLFRLAEEFTHDWFNPFEAQMGDWHELALAVVMRRKHGKTWDGMAWGTAWMEGF